MMCSISIRELTQEDSRQLASLLCEDCILRRDLGMARDDRPTGEAFDRHIHDWCRNRNAITYAIVFGDGTAIGTISLSHIDRGYAEEAARALLRFAFDRLELEKLATTHAVDNHASGRLLGKLGFSRVGEIKAWSHSRRQEVTQIRYELPKQDWVLSL